MQMKRMQSKSNGRMVCVRGEALPEVKSPINYIEHKAFEQLFAEALKNK